MQGILLVIGVVIMISSFYKSEKKKQEQANRQIFANRNIGKNKGSISRNISPKTNEETILEKARNTNMENGTYSGMTSSFSEPEVVSAVYSSISTEKREESRNEEKVAFGFDIAKEEVVLPTFDKKSKETVSIPSFSYNETFNGFCASDALYLAKKDAIERKSWI